MAGPVVLVRAEWIPKNPLAENNPFTLPMDCHSPSRRPGVRMRRMRLIFHGTIALRREKLFGRFF